MLVLGKTFFFLEPLNPWFKLFFKVPEMAALGNLERSSEMSGKPALSLILNAEKLGCNDLVTGSYGKQIKPVLFLPLIT